MAVAARTGGATDSAQPKARSAATCGLGRRVTRACGLMAEGLWECMNSDMVAEFLG